MHSPTSAVTDVSTRSRENESSSAPPQSTFHLFSFALGLLVALVLVGGTLFLTRRPDPAPIVLQPPPTPQPSATPAPTSTPRPITVFVSGAVHAPGLYLLPADARVGTAIDSAAGLTEDADAVAVNQAELLWDGAQVHVPAKVVAAAELGQVVMAAVPPAGVSGSGAANATRSGSPALDGIGGLINLNHATAGELETLPGIGPSKAEAIIVNRPYSAIDDLTRVPGIGAKTVEQLRALVTVQ